MRVLMCVAYLQFGHFLDMHVVVGPSPYNHSCFVFQARMLHFTDHQGKGQWAGQLV